jgi:hypothetical protein
MTLRLDTTDGYGRTFYDGPADYSVKEAHRYTGNSRDGWVAHSIGWDLIASRWYTSRGEKDIHEELIDRYTTKGEAEEAKRQLEARAAARG